MLEPATRPEGPLAQEEDDDILMDTSPADPTKKLLMLRKAYKKTKANLARTISHLGFLQACTELRQVPRGLQVGTKCHALLKDLTNVDRQFNDTSRDAERQYIHHLTQHYRDIEKSLRRDARHIEDSIAEAVSILGDSEALTEHERVMARTRENIERLESKLEETKAKKQRAIEHPQPRRKETAKGRKGMKLPKNNKKPKGAPNPPPPDKQNARPEKQPADHTREQPTLFSAAQLAQIAQMLGTNPAGQLQQAPQPLFPHTATTWPPGHQPPTLIGQGGLSMLGQPSTLAQYRPQDFGR
jgi:uncharacterized coiled-coil protein SlyX